VQLPGVLLVSPDHALDAAVILKLTFVAGYPSELYYRGSAMWETLYGMICAYPIVMFVFVPVYYSLGITSVYQVKYIGHTGCPFLLCLVLTREQVRSA
jgi:hypothetical protein